MQTYQKAIVLTLLCAALAMGSYAGFRVLNNKSPATDQQVETQEIMQEETPAPLVVEADARGSGKNGLLYIVISVLGISLASSIFLIIYLLNWRYKVSDTQVSVVPEVLLKALGDQSDALGQNTSYLSEYIKRISAYREKMDGDIVELQKSFAIFQDSLNQKDQEIERYRKGYDSAVYNKFLHKFIKFYIDLKKEADAPENQHSAAILNDMLELLEDALIECNVEIKNPSVMEQVEAHAGLIGGQKKSTLTNQQELHGRIEKVISPAFILKTQAGDEIIREASVSIYMYQESEAV